MPAAVPINAFDLVNLASLHTHAVQAVQARRRRLDGMSYSPGLDKRTRFRAASQIE